MVEAPRLSRPLPLLPPSGRRQIPDRGPRDPARPRGPVDPGQHRAMLQGLQHEEAVAVAVAVGRVRRRLHRGLIPRLPARCLLSSPLLRIERWTLWESRRAAQIALTIPFDNPHWKEEAMMTRRQLMRGAAVAA